VVVNDPLRALPPEPPVAPVLAVVWHDLECGGYRADLPLWRELAGPPGGPTRDPILDIGAGSGRVALELARAGHRVSAVDLDGELLDALRARAFGLDVEVIRADARALELPHREFGLCLAPMQTVQLLGGSEGRLEFLRRARAHLRPGGLLACAIVTDFEPFDCADGEGGPAAEKVRIGGDLYVSRATRVSMGDRRVLIERERRVLPGVATTPVHRPDGAPAERSIERNLIELDLISAEDLESEAREVGLSPAGSRRVPATGEHLGSIVVMLHA
jgi:SAM-dependent methyltransferase